MAKSTLKDARESQMMLDQKVRASEEQFQNKQKMLSSIKKERQTADDKVAGISQVLSTSETNLEKIRHTISNSPALQKQ